MMESKNTFIKLSRKILDWEWYKDASTLKLFIHLLLTANVKDKKWQGIIVKRGELITSVNSLTQQTGLSTFQVRRALNNLITTSTATKKTTNKYTVISIVNYEKYQAYSKQDNKRTTNGQQTNNKRTTTTKEYKEYKECKEREEDSPVFVSESDERDVPQAIGGTLGQGVLVLSDSQIEKLLEIMPLEVFNNYCKKLSTWIKRNKKQVENHYELILRWYKEDYGGE